MSDKDYFGQDLFDKLFVDGMHLITNLGKNRTQKSAEYLDRIQIRKRAVIESIKDVISPNTDII